MKLEYKYLVPKTLLNDIRSDIRPYVEIDQFAKKHDPKEYTVRSIYYDTPTFECYEKKIEGIKVRKKFRIRGYDKPEKDSIVFLEIKRKTINHIEKNRAPLLREQLKELFSTCDLDQYIIPINGNGRERSDAQRFFYHYFRKRLRPVVLVIYEREAFFSKFDSSLRLTFDKNLRSTVFPTLDMLYKEEQIQYTIPKYFIFEVKFFGKLPLWVRSIIKRYQLPRMAISKYAKCLDSHKLNKKYYRLIPTGFSLKEMGSVAEPTHISDCEISHNR